jgi:ubiquinone/menaquinone biosynthesis C-methylase UbiE
MFLLRWLNPGENDIILDIGCGIGKYDYFLVEKCKYLIGIDISFKAIKKASSFLIKKTNCGFVVCDAHFLPFKDSISNKIISLCCLEHFENDVRALSEMNRVLKQNGVLTLSLDSLSNPEITDKYRKRHKNIYRIKNFYSISTIQDKLLSSSFKIDRAEYLLTTKISSYFVRLGLKVKPEITNPLYILLFFVTYPLIRFSEIFASNKTAGFFLAVKAKKQDSKF